MYEKWGKFEWNDIKEPWVKNEVVIGEYLTGQPQKASDPNNNDLNDVMSSQGQDV